MMTSTCPDTPRRDTPRPRWDVWGTRYLWTHILFSSIIWYLCRQPCLITQFHYYHPHQVHLQIFNNNKKAHRFTHCYFFQVYLCFSPHPRVRFVLCFIRITAVSVRYDAVDPPACPGSLLMLRLPSFCSRSRSTRTWTSSSWRTATGWTRFQMTKTWIWSHLKQSTPPACAAKPLRPQRVKSSSPPPLFRKTKGSHFYWGR